ncbi:MAG TPA: PAS domain S-box protein, partial [bacterium]|nr:PAS domain S-box protein [bacterium]
MNIDNGLASAALADERSKQQALESSIKAIALADLHSRITYVNKACLDLWGYEDANMVLGRRVAEFWNDIERVDRIKQFVMDEGHWRGELEAMKRDGSSFVAQLAISLIYDDAGTPIGFMGSFIDITDHKLAELQVQQSEQKYRELYEEAPIGIFQTTASGNLLDVNRTMAEILGYDSTEEVVQSITDLATQVYVRPERRQEYLRILRTEGQLENFEFQAYRKDGQRIWLAIHARVQKRFVDNDMVIAGFIEDITERKNAEAELQESEQRYRLLAETIPDGICIYDLEGIIQYVNQTGARMFGEDQHSLEGRDISEFFPSGAMYELTLPSREPSPENSSPHIFKTEIRTRTGQSLPVEVGAAPRFMDDTFNGILLAMRDISKRQELEEQLQQSQKMEAVGRLAGGIAHDFNNLLVVIQGHSAKALTVIDEGHPAHKDLDLVNKAGEKAAVLTRQLLTFSRKQKKRAETIDCNELITELWMLLDRVIGENIPIKTRLADTQLLIHVDPGQLEQAIMNLAVNARDAMPSGGQLVIQSNQREISHSSGEGLSLLDPGAYVQIDVSDTGTGIPEDIQSHIFEPFFTTKEKRNGTGLGLSTVYGIAKQSGGHVEVDSTPGEGTTFSLYFPMVGEAKDLGSEDLPDINADAGNSTILVIEDADEVRDVICTILREYGYRVLDARGGEEALDIHHQYQNDIGLVITDVILPHMSGPEIAMKITEKAPDMHILYMSGYAEEM